MTDDEIDNLIRTLKEAGLPQTQVPGALNLLGHAEEFAVELQPAGAGNQKVREMLSGALLEMLNGPR